MKHPTRKFRGIVAGLLALATASCNNLSFEVGTNSDGSRKLAVRSPESTARLVLDRYRRKNAFGLYAMASSASEERYQRLHHEKEKAPDWNEVFGGWRYEAV